MDDSEGFATIVRDKVLRTEVRDVVASCAMLCEVDDAVADDDFRIERLTAALTAQSEPPRSSPRSPSFVLRLELDRIRMYEHGVTMLDIHKELVTSTYAQVTVSDDASRALIVRVIPWLDCNSGADVITELRYLEQHVLSTAIKGVKGVEKCIVQDRRCGKSNPNPKFHTCVYPEKFSDILFILLDLLVLCHGLPAFRCASRRT